MRKNRENLDDETPWWIEALVFVVALFAFLALMWATTRYDESPIGNEVYYTPAGKL